MWYVYILTSASSAKQEYTGLTQDLRQHLKDHNAGKSPHTSKYLQWYCAFPEKQRALEFEKYLKSHSGRAFARKRLTLSTTLETTVGASPTLGNNTQHA